MMNPTVFVVLCALLCVALASPLGKPAPVKYTGSPDFPANSTMIIRGYGYRCDDSIVETEDGFLLLLQRVRKGTGEPTKGPVFVQHGLGSTSSGWTLNTPDESLAYILADAGYDVYLGNNRGSFYAWHKVYTPDQKEFWDWSFDEIADYDLTSNIHKVLNISGHNTLIYVGHSLGTVQAFARFLDPKMASHVRLMVALAPVAYIEHIKAMVIQAMAALHGEEIFKLLGIKAFGLDSATIKKILGPICDVEPSLCMNAVSMFCGPDTGHHFNATRGPYYMHYLPSHTSVKNMAHLSQEVRSGQFCKYDYGTDNQKHYNSTTPPQYNMTKWSVPTAFFYGGNDNLADARDVEALLKWVPNKTVVYAEYLDDFNHVDFILGTDAYDKIYRTAINIMNQYPVSGR